MSQNLPRKVAEQVVLEPVRKELLAPEAVERFCDLIRGWTRRENSRLEQTTDPAIASIDIEIAEIEALIDARPARAATMRPLIEELRAKQANLRRLAQRKVQSALANDLPGVESYRAAVAELAETLASSNVEAARAQLRGLVGTVPVFAEGRKLFGRVGFDRAQLLRSTNPGFIESVGSGGPLRAL
jgi:hypothetical protein